MKKIFKTSWALIAMMLVFSVSCAGSKGQQAVDMIADAFNDMAKEVEKCTSINDLENLDFSGIGMKTGADDIDDSCKDYELTSADKSKLKKSFHNFYDAVVDKMVDFMGGLISRDDLEKQMDAMLTVYNNAVDNSDTLGDYVKALDNLNF